HHDKWGNAVTAFIVGPPGVTPEETLAKVARFAREEAGLPSLKQPKRFVVVEQIPKSAVGKVLRRQLSAGNFTVLADSDEGISR
ncbi:MAG: long-chain fatty acid--CoA ligase, partial [Mycobacterium sp.]|nr:long-chain fatty acid--CoA ligase [Mycobacterium sp.]